jgi:hypothetical protein
MLVYARPIQTAGLIAIPYWSPALPSTRLLLPLNAV